MVKRLVTGNKFKSCGCLIKESKSRYRHGLAKTRFYRIYQGIKLRCTKASHPHFNLYGGRGIKFHWKDFKEYRDDMYQAYLEHTEKHGEKDTTIERIDVNGHYCKENCRWATKKEQGRNRRSTFKYGINGEHLSMIEFSERFKIPYSLVVTRRSHGWTLEEIINGKRRSVIMRKNMKKIEKISMQLSAYLSILSDKERGILVDRFGLQDGIPKTLQEVANKFNLSRERVRQIEARALDKVESLDKVLTDEK